MADTKISDLTNGGTIQAGDYIPAVRAGSNIGISVSAGSIGFQLVGVGTTAAALNLLGGSVVGKAVFAAASTAAAADLLDALRSNVTGSITGADKINNAVSLTSAEFAAGSANATTMYLITDA